jgi:outer membrane lipoprotein-sorting protein
MTEVPPSVDDLGALLVLLHGADAAYRSVQATWRVWRHQERLNQAFRADAEEREETVRIWREDGRFREEHHGGPRDGYYAVADGPLWWLWDEAMGARSNEDDPTVGGGVGQELDVMRNPTPLLSSLRFRVVGVSEVAGRSTLTARASPRPYDLREGRVLALHQLGTGASEYELEIDRERGVLLAATAIRDGQPFHRITALAITFDEPISPETFRFTPPTGEKVNTSRTGLRQRHHLTLTEAQQRAPFTVLMPDSVPPDWQVSCDYFEASERPPSPAQIALSYRSVDGHESVSIDQMASAARALHHYENMVSEGDWQDITRNERSIKVRPAEWGQAQAHLEHDATFVFLVSDNLTGDQLDTLAAGLRAAPSVGSI